MPDSNLIENLIKTLQYEYRTYLDILEIAERKTDCLIKNDMAALNKITEEEKISAERTTQLNQLREKLLLAYSQETNKEYKHLTIAAIKEQVEGQYKKPLEDIHVKLRTVVEKLSFRNDMNRKLIENAIDTINFSIQLIASPQPAVPLYGRSGQEVTQNTKRSMLDVKY